MFSILLSWKIQNQSAMHDPKSLGSHVWGACANIKWASLSICAGVLPGEHAKNLCSVR
jgi:hypothetical protein